MSAAAVSLLYFLFRTSIILWSLVNDDNVDDHNNDDGTFEGALSRGKNNNDILFENDDVNDDINIACDDNCIQVTDIDGEFHATWFVKASIKDSVIGVAGIVQSVSIFVDVVLARFVFPCIVAVM